MKRTTSLRKRRHMRVRGKVAGTSAVPRLSVFRSNRHIAVQLIDDAAGKTLAFADDMRRKSERVGSAKRETSIERGRKIGELLAKRAAEKKIKTVVFDRGGYKYHGVVRAIAEGARRGGLTF